MSVHHFKSLLFRSAKIQEEIEKEHQSRWPNWMRLLKLKKLRLAIKDRMERLAYRSSSGKRSAIKAKARLPHTNNTNNNNTHWQNA